MRTLNIRELRSRHHAEARFAHPGRHPPDLRRRFEGNLRLDSFTLRPLSRSVPAGARQRIADALAPPATLDSLHVHTAIDIEADAVTADDRQLARAAAKHGLEVISFS